MDGIKNILARIDQELQQEIDTIHQETQAQLAERSAHYDTLIAQETKAILDRGAQEATQHEERLVSVAMVECRKLLLSARQNLVSQTYDQALTHLLALSPEEYVTLLASLASRAALTGAEEVMLSEQDRTRYGKTVVAKANELLDKGLPKTLTLSPHTRNIQGGLILSNGQVELNCSFETLIRLQRGVMDLEVAHTLFPQ